jgi:cytochrome c-type biogenesis protein CcmF
MLLINNVLFSVAALAVLTGTLYPLLLDVLGGEKISVGPPYFEAVFVPLMVPALMLMGVGPMARWKHSTLPGLKHQLRWALAASFVSALLLGLFLPLGDTDWNPMSAFGLLLATWCVCSTLAQAWQRLGASSGRAARQPLSWWGMLLAHLGIGIFVFGATLATSFETRRELTLTLQQQVSVGSYEFRLDGLEPVVGPNYDALRASISVRRDNREIGVLQPEKRFYRAQNMPLSQAAIDTDLTRDLFIALGDAVDEKTWTMRIQVKPFMAWIWAGCLLMAAGGLLALADRRYRTLEARNEKYAVTLASASD